ncbi:MAG: alpha/beta hydrolase [Pseudomonadota bacterium]
MQTIKSKDGTVLAYDVIGSGPALIYITGATCFRLFMPIVQDVKTFAKEFTVYNYDRRGRGDSGDRLPYAPEREVEDIAAMITAAGGSAWLYGHSSGAVLALEAALQLGNKINGIALYDAPYACDEKEKAEYNYLSRRVHELLHAGENAKALNCFLKGIGMPKFFVWFMPLMPGWKTMKALAPTLAYDIELTRDLPPVARISKINLPVYIIIGEKSPDSMRSVAQQLTQALPAATFTEVIGQDHMISAKMLLPILVKCIKG